MVRVNHANVAVASPGPAARDGAIVLGPPRRGLLNQLLRRGRDASETCRRLDGEGHSFFA